MQVIQLEKTIGPDDPVIICDALAHFSGLSKGRIKKAMNHGAVWRQRPGRKIKRIRRAKTQVQPGDLVALYYDESILNSVSPVAECIRDLREYSVWYKPANLITQGTRYGDHGTLTRQVEHYFSPRRNVCVVHRIDRETTGLILMAHSRQATAKLSDLFKSHKVRKTYLAWVRGDLRACDVKGTIDVPLDGRTAVSHYRFQRFDSETNQSLVQIRIVTGRHHQIRRHFEAIGHPVMGDPRYGRNNKNKVGLRLFACGLAFDCPLRKGIIDINIDIDKIT